MSTFAEQPFLSQECCYVMDIFSAARSNLFKSNYNYQGKKKDLTRWIGQAKRRVIRLPPSLLTSEEIARRREMLRCRQKGHMPRTVFKYTLGSPPKSRSQEGTSRGGRESELSDEVSLQGKNQG